MSRRRLRGVRCGWAVSSALLSMLWAAGAGAAAGQSPSEQEVVRVESSLELKYASGVLRQVAMLFSTGFVRRDADNVAREIGVLPADQTRLWVFNAVRHGVSHPLQVRARVDQSARLELDFFTAPDLAPEVRKTVDGYLRTRRR